MRYNILVVFWSVENVDDFLSLTCQREGEQQALWWCMKTSPGWVTEELHWIAEVTPPWSGENDALLRVQVKGSTKLQQSHHYGSKPHGVLTTFSPWPGSWRSTNGAHLFFCASLLSLNGWSKTRIIRAVPYAGQFWWRGGGEEGVIINWRPD